MLTSYIHTAMAHAHYEILPDGTFYGEIPDCRGVWADGTTLEACREKLQEVLEEWIIFRLTNDVSLPAIGGVALGRSRAA